MARLRDKPPAKIEPGSAEPFVPDPNSKVDPLIQEIASHLSLEDLLGVEGAANWEEWCNTPVDFTEYLAKSDEIWSKVPKEEWDELPTDLSVNLDHYLYGSPKKQQE